MKSILAAIASFSLATLLTGRVNAQELSIRIVNPETIKIAQAQTKPDRSKPDWKLFSKAITNFLQSDRYLTESESILVSSVQGANVSINFKAKTIAQSGRKFRSEISFVKPGETQKISALVICDGKQVWIYRPSLKQYTITPYETFKEVFTIGLSSSLFIAIPESSRKIIAQNGASGDSLKGIDLNNISGLQQEKVTINGEEFSVYNYINPKDNLNISGFVKPKTASLMQVKVKGQSQNLNIEITEKILQRIASPTIDAKTFTFTPPQGVKKVNSLSIGPF